MIISYNWQIIDNLALSLEDILKTVKLPSKYEQQAYNEDSHNTTLKHTNLRKPHFGFLFSYLIEQPKINVPELDLVPQLSIFQEMVRFKIVKQVKNKNYIYLQILIDDFQMYDNLLVLNVKIKYHKEKRIQRCQNIEQLVRMAGNRQINMQGATTHATIRKEIIVQSPFSIEHKQYKDGYLLVKLCKSQQYNDQVEVCSVEILNWVSTGNEALKKQIIQPMINGPFILKPKETFVLAYRMNQSMKKVQMPIAFKYKLDKDQKSFKMIRTLKDEQGKL